MDVKTIEKTEVYIALLKSSDKDVVHNAADELQKIYDKYHSLHIRSEVEKAVRDEERPEFKNIIMMLLNNMKG
jgi:hypothetical protein